MPVQRKEACLIIFHLFRGDSPRSLRLLNELIVKIGVQALGLLTVGVKKMPLRRTLQFEKCRIPGMHFFMEQKKKQKRRESI